MTKWEQFKDGMHVAVLLAATFALLAGGWLLLNMTRIVNITEPQVNALLQQTQVLTFQSASVLKQQNKYAKDNQQDARLNQIALYKLIKNLDKNLNAPGVGLVPTATGTIGKWGSAADQLADTLKQLKPILDNLKDTSAELKNAAEGLDELLKDPHWKEILADAAANMAKWKQMSQNGVDVSEDIKKWVHNFVSPKKRDFWSWFLTLVFGNGISGAARGAATGGLAK